MQDFFYPTNPQEIEKRHLRENANYVGLMMLALEGSMFLLGLLLQVLQQVLSPSLTGFLWMYAGIYAVAMALPAIIISVATKRRHFPLSPAKSVAPSDAFFGILASVGVCMAANIVTNIIVSFFQSVGVPKPEMPDYLQPTIPSLFLNLFVFAVLPALLEELVFRGYVLRAIRPYGDWLAVIVSSLLFALMHGNIAQIPFAMIVGIALGWLFIMTDNIWLSVAVHFTNNAFSLLLQYCTRGMDVTTLGMVNAFCIFGLIIIGALCLAILVGRRSVLFRRLPRRSSMPLGSRLSTIFGAPLFLIGIVAFVLLTVMDILGSMM